MAARRTAAGGDFDRFLKFLAGVGTLAGIVLTVRRFLR
jgi:hypothetical protein